MSLSVLEWCIIGIGCPSFVIIVILLIIEFRIIRQLIIDYLLFRQEMIQDQLNRIELPDITVLELSVRSSD